jgi:hypothetical protein
MSKHHQELTNGIGKCSVPMWCNGMPAGFCDKPAYSEPIKEVGHWENGVFYKQYIPGLACREHGGSDTPEDVVVELDGNEWCAHFTNFINLQESPAEFSKDKDEAILKLLSCQAPPQNDAVSKPEVNVFRQRVFGQGHKLTENELKFIKHTSDAGADMHKARKEFTNTMIEFYQKCHQEDKEELAFKEAEIGRLRSALSDILFTVKDAEDMRGCGIKDIATVALKKGE